MKGLQEEYLGETFDPFDEETHSVLEFYANMIKSEDHHKISSEVRERSSFYGMYNIYTKNKLLKMHIKQLKADIAEEHSQRQIMQKIVYGIQKVDGEKFDRMHEMS